MELEADFVRDLLASIKKSPVKELGQNFLLDGEVVKKMVAVGLPAEEKVVNVMEVGPGLGILTKEIIEYWQENPPKKGQPRLIAVERDPDLAKSLPRWLMKPSELKIVEGDVVHFDRSQYFADGDFILIANLPFQVTNFILSSILTESPRPKRAVIMIQKEVADRVLAKPKDSSRGMMSVIAEYFAEGKRVLEVPKTSFWPEPKVDATVISLKITRPLDDYSEQLFKVVKAGFSQRRKNLKNALSGGLGLKKEETEALLAKAEISTNARAQELTLVQWQELTNIINA